MKKILLFLSVLLVIVGVTTPLLAEGDPFVPSIGVRADVIIEGGEYIFDGKATSMKFEEEDHCWTEVIVTPYVYKDTIESENSRDLMAIAYEMILNTPRVVDLDPEEITNVAHSLGVEIDDLVIRDLFDITKYHRTTSNIHDEGLHQKYIEITLKTQTLKDFVCLLHYKDGSWNVVDSARVIIDENHLYLSVDELSPFAIVVATDYKYVAPVHSCCIWHWLILLTTLITILITIVFMRKKKKDDEDKEELTQEEKEEREEIDKKNKKVKRNRHILSLINIILCVIFYILGGCKYCLYALLLDILVILVILFTSRYEKEEENSEKE